MISLLNILVNSGVKLPQFDTQTASNVNMKLVTGLDGGGKKALHFDPIISTVFKVRLGDLQKVLMQGCMTVVQL